MKKLLLSLLSVVFFATVAYGGEFTIEFKDGGGASDKTSQFAASKPVADFVSAGSEYLGRSIKSVTKVYSAKTGYGLKFSSGSINGSLELSFTGDGVQKITKIVATAAAYPSDLGNVPRLTINDVVKDLTSEDLQEYTFDYTPTEASTTLLIKASYRLYLTKLVITYEDEVVTPPAPAVANMAIQKTVRTATLIDYRVIVPWEVAGHGSYAESHNAQDSYSVGMWFRPTGTHSRDGGLLMSHATNNHCNTNGLWFIKLNSTGAITIGAASGDNLNGAATGLDGASAGSVTMNEWHYMLFSVDNVNLTASVYIDGEKTMSKTLAAPLFYKWGDGVFHFASNGFGGELDQAEIYSTGLTDDEAAQAYADPSKVASVRAVYTFDEIAEGTTSQFANTLGFGATENAVFQKYTGQADWGNGPVDTGSTGTNHSEEEYAPTLVDGRVLTVAPVTYALTVEANGCEYTLTDSETGAAIEDLAAIAENTGLTLSITSVPEGKVLSSVTLGETALEANEGGVYTFTVTGDATLTIAVEDAPVPEYTVTYTGEHSHMMYQGEESMLEVPAEGFKMTEGSNNTVQLVVDEGYELKSMTLNGADVTESFALGLYTITNISADQNFVAVISEAKAPGYEYTAPGGTTSPSSYLTGIASNGAVEEITYTSSSHPGLYTVLDQEVSARAGSEFTLEFIANSLGGGSTTTVHQDLRFCAAYIFADWYGNGEFTLLNTVGKVPPTNNIYGNYDEVMDIIQPFTVPADVEAGKAARIRIIYADAWSKPGATGSGQTQTPDANSQYIDKGIAYDIVVNTLPGVYAVTYEAPENGTIAVMLGETPLISGTEVEGGTEITVTATPAPGYSLETLTANGEAIEAGAYTVNGNVAFAATFVETPGNSILVPAATFSSGSYLYSFRFDDAPLGEHTNGTNTESTDHRTRNFTYSAWINIKDGAQGKPVMSNIQSAFVDACGAFQVKYIDGKLTLNGRDATSISTFKNIDGSATLDEGTPLDEWVFVSVVADQENQKVTLYKNCQEISSYSTTYGVGLLQDEAAFAISDKGAPVAVAEVQLWNKALTLDELKASYNLEETPEALVAYYKAAEFVEGSATELRNLGSEGATTAKLLYGKYYYDSSSWSPYFQNVEAKDIELTGEERQLKSVNVTVNPVSEGNTVALTGFKGREITDQANLFERINAVPTLAEGVELLGVKVLEANGRETVYTPDELPFFANDDITVSFQLSDKYLVKATVTNGTAQISVNDGEREDLPEAGKEVENGSKVVVYFFPPEENAGKYSLTAFTVNGEDRLADMAQNVYAIDAIDADYTFEATFSLPQHHLSVVNPDGDPIESFYGEFRTNNNVRFEYDDAEGLDVDEGTSVMFVILPPEQEREGYATTLKAVTDNGTDVTETLMELNGEWFYPMGAITEDHVLKVSQDVTGIIAISADADNALSFADGKLTVAEDAVIEVVDINGRLVARAEGTALAVDDLVKGVYVAKAVTADAVYTLKFIKL